VIPSAFRGLIDNAPAAFFARPPDDVWRLCLALTSGMPDQWCGGCAWREGDLTVWELFYDRHGRGRRRVLVQQRGEAFRLAYDSDTDNMKETNQ
jgi:hypothetical protein